MSRVQLSARYRIRDRVGQDKRPRPGRHTGSRSGPAQGPAAQSSTDTGSGQITDPANHTARRTRKGSQSIPPDGVRSQPDCPGPSSRTTRTTTPERGAAHSGSAHSNTGHAGTDHPGEPDPGAMLIPKLRRLRSPAHLAFVRAQPCLICGRSPADAHHLRFVQPRAMGRKVSDEFTVPLCRYHHSLLHRDPDEPGWWSAYGIDPLAAALLLWEESRGGGM